MYRNWYGITKPEKLEVEKDSLSETFGKFSCEPLMRGFGNTIGNSLRRILLSSLRGFAVTAVKIDGVLHEYSAVPEVKEDVTEIVMNLKRIVPLLFDTDRVTVSLEMKGPCRITAGHLVHDRVKILNPDLHIATVGAGGHIRMDVTICSGRGYQESEKQILAELPIGTIPIDALFSPVTKVNYAITNARVGDVTDFDKLALEVWTNGVVRPEDAVGLAAKILKEHMDIFINFDETVQLEMEEEEEEEEEINRNLYRSVDELELSVRAANCLQNANIRLIGELVQKTESEMLKTKNFGRKSLNEIKEILAGMGLSLGMKLDNFPQARLREEETT